MITTTKARRNHFDTCKFCSQPVNMDDEGVGYPDGTSAHEECDDSDTFRRENAGDFRD